MLSKTGKKRNIKNAGLLVEKQNLKDRMQLIIRTRRNDLKR